MNMHKHKLVACIKSNGKVLREYDDTVRLNFGAEYSIFLKNLNTVRASVRIEIDGKDVLGGTSLVIDPKSELNLERFLTNGNMEKGNRFKFIERNAKVEAARGIGSEDGLIRIEFQFERDLANEIKNYKQVIEHHYHYTTYPTYWNCSSSLGSSYGDSRGVYGATYNSSELYSSSLNSQSVGDLGENTTKGAVRSRSLLKSSATANAMLGGNSASVAYSAPVNDAGITAPGSVSDQKFTTVSPLMLESEKNVIVLKLLGETESGKRIEQPVTVKSKNKCIVCNRVNKATAKFCTDCGAGLEIVK